MDPTLLLYGLMIGQNVREEREREQDRKEQDRKEQDAFWKKFHDDMDRTFKR